MNELRVKTVGEETHTHNKTEGQTAPIPGSKKSQRVINKYLSDSIGKIEGELKEGKLILGDSHSIEELLLNKHHVDSRGQKRSKQYHQRSRMATSRQCDVSSPGKELSPADHRDFISKIVKEKKRLLKRAAKRAAESQDQQLRESLEKSRNEQERRRQEVESRRKRIEASLSDMRMREENRISELEQQNKKLKQIKSRRKLHEVLEQRFEKCVILPQLQQNKHKLEQIKEAHKPIDLSLIRQHQSEYLLQINRRQTTSIKSRASNRKYDRPLKLQKFLEQQKKDRSEELFAKKKELEEKILRMEEYSQRLGESFKPRIDPNKKKQIEERLVKQKEEVLRLQRILEKDNREDGLKNLEYAKKKKINQDLMPRKETETTGGNLQNSAVPQIRPAVKVQQVQEIRAKKIKKMMSGNLRDPYNYERVRTQTSKMDQQIGRKEQIARHSARQKIDEQLTNMLLENIRIKMKLFQNSQ